MESPTKRPKTKGVPVTKLLGSQTPISSTSKSTKKVKQKLETRFSLASHETVAPPANAKNSEPKQQGPRRLVVVSGSYDKILYGLQIEPKSEESEEVHQFKPIFIFPAHISCIKAVAASPRGGKWLVSGGTDEVIKVWDLRRKKELGSLQQHQGSLTHLSFPTRTHLLSASEDGTICLYHTRDWAVLATLKGHRDRVNDVAVHPSAKVCLSVGKDRTLRMWDLMRGKSSASVKLGKEGECVRWTPSGTRFVISAGSSVDIYSTKMTLLQTVMHPARVHDVLFCKGLEDREVLLVAAEDKKVTLYVLPRLAVKEDEIEGADTTLLPVHGYLTGHSNRVKALDVLVSQGATFVATASSDGRIHLYDLTVPLRGSTTSEPQDIYPVAAYDTNGSRLTCVTLVEGEDYVESILGRKRKHEEGDEDENEEEDD